MSEKIAIIRLSVNDRVDIMGHSFCGLKEIRAAVSVYVRVTDDIRRQNVSFCDPESPVDGIYVAEAYEMYPCFDSYDYANEDRFYRNFFFSSHPFSEEEVSRLASLKAHGNARLVDGDMPLWATPAIYYSGSGDEMVMAKAVVSADCKDCKKDDVGGKSQKMYNLIILDESGSMHSIKRQTIDGFNERVQTIRAAQDKFREQTHYVTLVSFNSWAIKTVCDRVPVSQVRELGEDDFHPSCSTPLYDAMGQALTSLSRNVGADDTVLVTVITDGEENSSREYNGNSIRRLVDELKDKGWVFTYIGANQDAGKVAASISINNSLNFHASGIGTKAMYDKERVSLMRFFTHLSMGVSRDELANDYFNGVDGKD